MKSTPISLVFTLLFGAIIGGSLLVPQRTAAAELDCAILPQSFCKTADDDLKKGERATSKNSATFMLLEWVLGILTAGIGIVAIGAFVYAGIMYSSASGNAEQVKKAKDIMLQTVIGLVVFAAIGIVLVWLIPGGVF